MIVEYKQFESGQKVKNEYGQILTVLLQQGCRVIVEEECFGHYHPNKLYFIDMGSNNLANSSLSHQQ